MDMENKSKKQQHKGKIFIRIYLPPRFVHCLTLSHIFDSILLSLCSTSGCLRVVVATRFAWYPCNIKFVCFMSIHDACRVLRVGAITTAKCFLLWV